MGTLGQCRRALPDLHQIRDERPSPLAAGRFVGRAQQGAGVDGDPAFAAVGELLGLPAQGRDGHYLAEVTGDSP